MKFSGKTVLVTGAGAGIGRAISLLFLGEGATVFALDSDAEALQALSAVAENNRLQSVACDVAEEASVTAAVAHITSAQRIDILVNNAGINTSPASVTATSPLLWEKIIDTNLASVFRISRAVIPHMNAGGAIVNISSILGIVGAKNCAAYAASKAGIIALTKSMALDYAPGIRVNCVCPGAIDTRMFTEYLDRCTDPTAERTRITEEIPLQRLGTPEDIAKAVAFLASGEAGWITGAVLVADGGDSI